MKTNFENRKTFFQYIYILFNNFNYTRLNAIFVQSNIVSSCWSDYLQLSTKIHDQFQESFLKLSSSCVYIRTHTAKNKRRTLRFHFVLLAILIKIVSHPPSSLVSSFRHSAKTETRGVVGSGEFLRIISADDNRLTKRTRSQEGKR